MKSLQVLIIATSHKNAGRTTADTEVWVDDLASPNYIFKYAGECLTISTPAGGLTPVKLKNEAGGTTSVSTKEFKTIAQATYHQFQFAPVIELKAEDYDAVFIAGSHGSMVDMAGNQILTALLKTFTSKNNVVGAIASGVVALLPFSIEEGKPYIKSSKITAYNNSELEMDALTYEVHLLLESQLLSLGAFYSRSPYDTFHVVVDGKLVTGQNPASSADAAKELLFIARNSREDSKNIFSDAMTEHATAF